MLNREGYVLEADLWPCGVVLYIMSSVVDNSGSQSLSRGRIERLEGSRSHIA